MMARFFSSMAACVVLLSTFSAPAADVFRMETDIFVGGRQEPLVQYLTLFTERIVYDFRVTKPEEVTVYDLEGNRVVLIDPARKWKSTLTTEEVLQFTAALKSHIEPSNQVFYAATVPNFELSEDEKERRVTLANKFITAAIAGGSTYLSLRLAQRWCRLQPDLSDMNPGQLMGVCLIFSVVSPLAHQIWYTIDGETAHFWPSFSVMALGDWGGSVIALMEVPRSQIHLYGCAAVELTPAPMAPAKSAAGSGDEDVPRAAWPEVARSTSTSAIA